MLSRSTKFGLQPIQKDYKLSILSDKLRTYAGFYSDESGDDLTNKKKTTSKAKIDALKIDSQVSDLKDKIFKKPDWIKILENNDLESTPATELFTSLRYGAPTDL